MFPRLFVEIFALSSLCHKGHYNNICVCRRGQRLFNEKYLKTVQEGFYYKQQFIFELYTSYNYNKNHFHVMAKYCFSSLCLQNS